MRPTGPGLDVHKLAHGRTRSSHISAPASSRTSRDSLLDCLLVYSVVLLVSFKKQDCTVFIAQSWRLELEFARRSMRGLARKMPPMKN